MALMTQEIAMMLYGSNKKWKKRVLYHKRSLSETTMYRVKQLLGGKKLECSSWQHLRYDQSAE